MHMQHIYSALPQRNRAVGGDFQFRKAMSCQSVYQKIYIRVCKGFSALNLQFSDGAVAQQRFHCRNLTAAVKGTLFQIRNKIAAVAATQSTSRAYPEDKKRDIRSGIGMHGRSLCHTSCRNRRQRDCSECAR